jgi:hypothetical protein
MASNRLCNSMIQNTRWWVCAVCFCASLQTFAAPALPEFDFTKPEVAREWGGPHHISALKPGAEGLEITLAGDDPYFYGPARDYPAGQQLWMFIRLKSEQGGLAQLFYFNTSATEENSRRFNVPAKEWTDIRIALPALGPGHRLRLDPPGNAGQAVIARIRFEPRLEFQPPKAAWKKPAPGVRRVLASGNLELWANPQNAWGCELRLNGKSMGFGHPALSLSCLAGNEQVWINVSEPTAALRADAYTLRAQWPDAYGTIWKYEQVFRAGKPEVIEIETTIEGSRDRQMLYLPLFLLSAGEQSFGANKNQALFAGLEYLENEPSSSEADLIGPEARRQVPSNHKITFPLMAVQAQGQYLGVIWDEHLNFSAVFDSPDRLYGSGGHTMGVIWPASDGQSRTEGSLVPMFPQTLTAGRPLKLNARIIGGQGNTIIPAVQKYVQLRGLPAVPKDLPLRDYVRLAAQGWLKSKAREGNRYRHAVWPGFGAQPAGDAAVYQTWLASFCTDAGLSNDLRQAAGEALALVASNQFYYSGVGHIRTPVTPLVFGAAAENLATARTVVRDTLRRLGDDRIIRYRQAANQPDYGRTYWTNHANGMTGRAVADLLEAVAFTGERTQLQPAIECLRAMDRYQEGVPRGAQTWEIPLHTPDILASAHLVNAYVTGYELTGDRRFLEQAIYWAWTGVPFVYLVNPTGKPVGPYSTIAVLGGTSWRAPVWFGQPVQWCGLVYADALYRLALIDRGGIWKQLADGITATGLQHTWKADDAARVGLLPDFYLLNPQRSDGPAINPGTVGINAPRLYGLPPVYEFRGLRICGLNMHAPGQILPGRENEKTAHFLVRGWPRAPYYVLVNGLARAPKVRINEVPVILDSPHQFDAAAGCLLLQVSGNPEIEITLP